MSGLGPCPVCGRDMSDGPSVDRHHWTPRTKGGREADPLHVICHRMIHRVFSEAELAAGFVTPEAIREHPEMERFIRWVRRKPADYVDWPKAGGTGGNKRRPARKR